MNLWSTEDTVAAVATAPGAAGLAVVRVSGPAALACVDRVFRGRGALARAPSHTLHHGWIVWPEGGERRLDEVVVAVFRAPRSYTREDVVEVSCHGGELTARRVLEALLAAGARLARGGEFTLRAFLNGRLDLVQAEAVADLIHAQSETAREMALAQLGGELSRRLHALGERIADAVAEVEARVDFAEDVGGVEVPRHVIDAVSAVDAELAELLSGAAYARAVRDGMRIPLVGRPNVGKSSLFNALVGEERAIVTPIPGTTRDRVSESVELAGVRVTLSDTAGLRAGQDEVERVGVARTHETLAHSPVVIWVVDASACLEEDDALLARALSGKRVLVALNKSDLPARVRAGEAAALLVRGTPSCPSGAPPLADETAGEAGVVPVSARTCAGVGALRTALASMLGGNGGAARAPLAPGNERHVEALLRARAALARAAGAAGAGMPGEIVALELREAGSALGEVTGQSAGEDLLERIFNRFCVGK